MRRILLTLAFAVPSRTSAQIATSPAVDRAQLEQRVKVQMVRVLRDQVGLNEAQITHVQELSQRIEEQRLSLNRLEQQARISLREEVLLADTSRNAVVAQLIDQIIKAQDQKTALLATFMTPMQRAKVFGIEDLIRRRVNEMLRQGMTADSTARPVKPMRNPTLLRRRPSTRVNAVVPN
jgi:aminopeptidase N